MDFMETTVDGCGYIRIATDNGITMGGEFFAPLATFIRKDYFDSFEEGEEVELGAFMELILFEDVERVYAFVCWNYDTEDWEMVFTVNSEIWDLLSELEPPDVLEVMDTNELPRW